MTVVAVVARGRASLPGTLALATALALLAGCQSLPVQSPAGAAGAAPGKSEPFRNVYTHDKDSAPLDPRRVDYENIPDAVPRDEPPGKYGNKSPYVVLGKTYEVLPDARGYRAEGIASWYGEKFQGFRTSSMEMYDMYAMTGAHKTLPIPSYVRVTNLENNRAVIVRVNDRGPFHDDRVIDLSWAAAQKLGYAAKGTARVRLETVGPDAAAAVATTARASIDNGGNWHGFCVQLGAFAQPDAARRLSARAQDALAAQAGNKAAGATQVVAGNDGLFRVRLGPYADRAQAERMRDQVHAAGLGDAMVLALP